MCRSSDGRLTKVMPPSRKLIPSNLLADSMTRSSITGSSPRAAASGALVSRARSSGEVTRWTMSRSPMVSATRRAIRRAEVGEVEPVAAAVEDALGVVDLAVAEQVDDRLHQERFLPSEAAAAAAARAAAGSASRTVCTARSSWAADTNHASYAEGGR